jgi:hypothetical protein
MRAQEFINEDLTRRGFLRGLGAAAMAGAAGSALAQNTNISAALKNLRPDDPRIRHAQDVDDLAKAIYQNMVAERGQPMDRQQQNTWVEIAREKAAARFSQYRPGAQPAAKPAAGFPSQGSEYRKARDIDNFESVAEGDDKKQSVRRIQKMLNDRFHANLDIDGVLGPLTQKSINRFMPSARPGSADEPNKTTAVQGKTVKDHNVAEAFDQPYKTKSEKSDYGDVDMLAKLPDGTNLSIMFSQPDKWNDTWGVEFYRNNSQEVTGEGDAQRIFATVLAAIQKFIKKHQPEKLFFSASKEVELDQNSESRAKLYDRLVQRYARAWGYRAFRADTGSIVRYELSRIKPAVAEEQLDELSFLGSECTKDCSGHRAGYEWSKRKGLRQANSWSPSFNKGAGLAVAGK